MFLRRAVEAIRPRLSRRFSALQSSSLKYEGAFASNIVGISSGDVDQQLRTTKLDNGLTIATQDSHDPVSVVGVCIDTGSRYETPATRGHSHLLEKIAFKSTKRNTSDQIVTALSAFGCNVSASAARDHLVLSAEVLRKFTADTVAMLGDVTGQPEFFFYELNNAKWEYQEFLKRQAAEYDIIVQEKVHEAAYGRTGLGNSLYANQYDLDNITKESLTAYVKEAYVGSKMVFVGVGVDHDVLVAQVENSFGSFPAGTPVDTAPPAYVGGDIRNHVHNGQPDEVSHICVALESADWKSDDVIATCVLQTMMGGGSSFSAGGPGKGMYTRLYENVLNRHEWVESCQVYNSVYADSALFGIYGTAGSLHAQHLAEVIVNELKSMANPQRMRPGDLARAKNMLSASIDMNLESRLIVFEDIYRQLGVYGRRFEPEELIAQIDQVSEDDIIRVAEKMLTAKPSVVVEGDTHKVAQYNDIAAGLSR